MDVQFGRLDAGAKLIELRLRVEVGAGRVVGSHVGVNDAGNGNGLLKATVTGGLPAGNYRVCTMTGTSNHQPPLMPIAQRGPQEDCTKFTVGQGNNGGIRGNGGNVRGNGNSVRGDVRATNPDVRANGGGFRNEGGVRNIGGRSRG